LERVEGGVGDDDVAAVAIEVGNCLFIDSARDENGRVDEIGGFE
jgi:hypothetical protein